MEKNKNKVIIIAYMQLQFTDVMKKNVGLANCRVSLKCKFNKYVYEATNILFTFENRGGALKQTENR